MKNTFGNSVAITLFGESHGEYIGAVIDGLAPGLAIHEEYIAQKLTLRRPDGKISTPDGLNPIRPRSSGRRIFRVPEILPGR